VDDLAAGLVRDHPFLTPAWALRLVHAYGTEAREVLGDAKDAEDLGRDFGATLTAAEVDWQMDREYARTADDVLWRRTKLGLRVKDPAPLEAYMAARRTPAMEATA
jgi:glycerol-3-phosphate dehydrogenase